MLDSERAFKIKVRLLWTVFKILFTSSIMCIQFIEFCMETRLSNIFKTTNVKNLTKVIQKSSCRVLKVTSKQKTLKLPVYSLKAVEFCSTFDIQIDLTLAIFREKLQNHTFQKTHRSLSKHANIHINRANHYEITALLSFSWWLLFLKNILLAFGIFNE